MDTTAAVVSQPRGDPHGNSSDVGDNLPNGGRGDGDARPAALKQGAEDKHRNSATKKGLHMLMNPASPIISLTKKFRSRPSRGASLEGLQALSGLDGSGEFVMTPVGSEGARVGDDGEVSCAGSDGASEISGESVEEGGGGGGDVAAAAGGAGRPKRAGKLAMVRGISQGLRRIKKRPVGESEAMTLGRASLMGDRDSDNSYLRAHDLDGGGSRSYTGGWGKRPSSPERKIPQNWDLPLTNIPTPSSASAAAQHGQPQNKAVSCSSSSSRPASPSPSPTKVLGLPPVVPPQMQRGLTEPCTAYSSARSLESPRKEDMAELGRQFGSGEVCRTPATASPGVTPGGRSVQEQQARGRPVALGKSKSVSPKGKWEVGVDIAGQARSASAEREGSIRRGPSRSASPQRRRSPFSRSRPQTPRSPQSPQACSPAQDDTSSGPGGLRGFHQEGDSRVQASSAGTASEAVAAAVCEAKENLKSIWHEKNRSDESIKGVNGKQPKVKEQNQQQLACSVPAGDADADAASISAAQPTSPCCVPVPAAPPSELKYGDRLRLWVRLRSPSRNHHRLAGGSDISLNLAAGSWSGPRTGGKGDSGAGPSDGVLATGGGGGGYVGSLDKVQRVSKKLFKRSELAMIGQPEGNAAGFAPCHFKAVDPENKRRDGDVVRYGDVVLLVDDRDYVWTDNAHLLPGSLRMKSRGSKRQITVAFKPFLAELKADEDNVLPPVVFGPQGLQIMTVDHCHKDSGNRKRRVSSRKSFHALTAFSKKNSGGSNVAGAFLCSDGRGEAIVFEVHLPNASPVGDPSPVVTKVTIHVDEQSHRHNHQHLQQGSAGPPPRPAHPAPRLKVPSLEAEAVAPGRKTSWPSPNTNSGEAPTAPLTPLDSGNGIVGGSARGSGDLGTGGSDNGLGVGSDVGSGVFEEGEKPRRPKSMVAKRLLKNVHKRRSSLNNSRSDSRSGSFPAGLLDGRVSRTNLYSLSTNANSSGPGRSSINADGTFVSAPGGDDEVSEDGDASSGGEMVLGAFEGLKWGEMVQFKMPAEGEVEPNDPLLTLRLSNRYTATLTARQLRDNAGLGKFPVKASKMKGPRAVSDPSGDLPSGNGLVYLRCTLTPIVCPGAEGASAAMPKKTPSADEHEQPAGWLGGRLLRALFPKQGKGGAVMARASSVMDMGTSLVKADTRGRVWPRVVNSTRLMLVLVMVLAAALLSVLLLGTNFSSSSMSAVAGLGFPPRSLSAAPSKASSSSSSPPSPSPCTSVWDVRRPDGTAYPHNQLSAAAAVLGSVDFEDKSSKGGGKGRKHRQQAQPRPQESNEEPGGSGSGSGSGTGGGSGARSRTSRTQPTYPGGGRASGTIPSEVDGNGDGAGEGEGVVRALAGERAGSDGGQAYGGGGGGGGGDGSGHVGFGLRSVAAAIGLAAVAGIVVLMKGLFGLWNGDTVPESPAPSSPMQAQVHLLGWDGRRMSEAARASEDIDTLFYPPPSGSSLEPMPHRFLLAESMDVAKAWARWEMTLDWRKETNADNILSKPHPRFALIKSRYAHCFHLPDKGGRVTYYERPGMSDFAEMKKVGITKADLLDHYVYCMEYLWQVLQPRQSQRITIIIDLAGVKFRDLVGESLAFLKTSVGMMSRHYPQRSFKIMILNAPSFFNSVFALVKPMLNEATKKKIDLLPVANVGEEMMKVIPAEHLPAHYGGTGEAALGESPAELALLAHVQKVLEENGQAMQTI